MTLVAGENRSCPEHQPKYDGALVNCATCKRWDPNELKCREEIWMSAWLTAGREDTSRGIESLMRHDAFRRSGSGGLRQIRRGS